MSFKTVPVLALSLGLGARGGLSVSAAGPASSTVPFGSGAICGGGGGCGGADVDCDAALS